MRGAKLLRVGIDERAVGGRPALGQNQRALPGGVEVGQVVLAVDGRPRVVVAQAEVHGQTARDLDVVLDEERVHAQALVHEEHVGQGRLLHIAQQAVGVGQARSRHAGVGGIALAGEDAVEVELPARGGDVLEIVAQRHPQVGAEFELVFAAGPGDAVGELVLLGDLELGQEVG